MKKLKLFLLSVFLLFSFCIISQNNQTDIYAKDANGKPYSPGWYTPGLKASYQIVKNLQVTVGWENITNQRYRSYSSGIVAAGSNFIVSLRTSF